MKILYEISQLGIGHASQQARTGIFRVIENVAWQLVSHPECEITFCSNLDRMKLEYSLEYWKNTPAISGAQFSLPPYFENRLHAEERKWSLIREINNNTALTSVRKFQLRLQIKQLQAASTFYTLYNDDLIHPKDVKSSDIYHSPFYPLPEQVYKNFKSVLLTYYDLIPVLFPQYFEDEIKDIMRNILQSITPETWVLCISANTRNDLLNYLGKRINPDRVLVTELAASGNFYKSTDKVKNQETRKNHHIPDAPYILSLCTLEPRKNIDQVIRAFARLIAEENIPDLYLVLVGSKGWLFDKIFDELNNIQIRNRIIITGFVADEDLAALYSDAMFFVYPSIYEGFGLPPLEAMKCGTPVITSNTSSLPEVVGEAGIMVSPTDIDALCHAMLSVYKSPALQKELSDKSLKRAELFSWEKCGQETVNAYKLSLRM